MGVQECRPCQPSIAHPADGIDCITTALLVTGCLTGGTCFQS